jgi:hypothetical protein
MTKCAFHLDESPNIEVCSNTGNNTYRLFHLSGSLDYCDFAQNDIQTHWQGLICAKQPASMNTIIGLQLWHENTWLDASSYTRYSAYHQDFQTGVNQLENGFKVDPDFPTHMPPGVSLTPPKVKPSNWFVSQNPIPDFEEENSDCIGGGEPNPEPPLGGWDGKVIDGTYPYESPSQLWDAHRDLSYKLLEHPEARPTGSVAQVWYDAQVNSSPWQFARFEQLYFNAFKIPAADQTALDNARNTLKTKLTEFAYLDSLQNADPSEDATIRQQQSDKAAEVVTAQDNFVTLAQQANSIVQTALNTAETQLNSLPTTQVWESNRKTLYAYWLKQARGQELTETELNVVRSIANQCPLEGGFAVREIPLLLPVPESYEYSREDYWYDCVDSVQGRSNIHRIAPVGNTLSVYPNPANNQVTFFLTRKVEADWMLTDISGRVWRNGKVSPEQQSFVVATEAMPTGIYFCTVRTTNGLTMTRKISVQH